MTPVFWEINKSAGPTTTIGIFGDWRLGTLETIPEFGSALPEKATTEIVVDGSQLTSLDTAGAMHLLGLLKLSAPKSVAFINFSDSHRNILDLVKERLLEPLPPPGKHQSLLQEVGLGAIKFLAIIRDTLNFLGRTLISFWEELVNPKRFRLKETFVHLETACVNAIPIVALVTGLIGIVIAYLYASQMEKYGANIFVVDGLALAMCRELSPIITAILVAGRSGSAFTAQIGIMKINEELDALVTLGLSPMHVLVVPRVLALIIALPILVFVGDVVGIFAGGIIANLYLGISPVTFLERLDLIMRLKTLLVGLCKAPIFAMFIGIISCRMGLNVEDNARSVGLHTTSTVVQSIVSVILLNAFIAVLLVELKI